MFSCRIRKQQRPIQGGKFKGQEVYSAEVFTNREMELKRRNLSFILASVLLSVQTLISPSLEIGAKRMNAQR